MVQVSRMKDIHIEHEIIVKALSQAGAEARSPETHSGRFVWQHLGAMVLPVLAFLVSYHHILLTRAAIVDLMLC